MKIKVNRFVLVFVVAALLSSFTAASQEVILTSVQVRKGFPQTELNQSFQFEMVVLTDVSNFTSNLDKTKTRFTKITDDTGFDLLAAQKTWEDESEGNYWYAKASLESWGPLNEEEDAGFIMNGKLSVIPNSEAKTVNVQGVIAMINIVDKESDYSLKNIATNQTGSETEIGQVNIKSMGSIGSDDAIYEIYSLESDGKSITKVEVVGGDDREEAAKLFQIDVLELELGENQVIYKSLPETINLKVVAKDTEIKEIPFDLNLSLGL